MIVEKQDVIKVLQQLIDKLTLLLKKLEEENIKSPRHDELLEALYKSFKKDCGIIDISMIGLDIF